MATRKRTPKAPKRAGGPTQPEGARKAAQVKLRLLPATERNLDRLAKLWGCSRSAVVATLLVNELGRYNADGSYAADDRGKAT